MALSPKSIKKALYHFSFKVLYNLSVLDSDRMEFNSSFEQILFRDLTYNIEKSDPFLQNSSPSSHEEVKDF